jgi:hypothetical protein
VTVENETFPDVSVVPPPDLPYPLDPGANVTFLCSWNWTDYREKNATIAVYTLQDFTASYTQVTTARVILTITDVLFDVADPSYFNVTVENSEFSVEEYVNITRVTVTVENRAPENITIPPQTLYANKSVTFTCPWNWSNYWNEEVSITVYTLQGYSAHYSEVTPSPVIISDVLFNLSDATHFNVTVKNSEFFSTWILVTGVTATLENGTVQNVTVVSPSLPYILRPDERVEFECSWNWTAYYNQNITITVNTLRGYVAHNTTVPAPVPIIIEVADVLFNVANTTQFNVTVRNFGFSLEDANITSITVTVENETALDIQVLPPLGLPYSLDPGANVTFRCSWNWTGYRGKNVTVTVYTLQGYVANLIKGTPEPVNLTITKVLFDPANTTIFSINVTNSQYSITQVNITLISVTLQNGTSWNVTVEPPQSLPYTLYPNETVTFKCLWNWDPYRGQSVTIKVETLEGYEAIARDVPIP